jgi:hypothetical protein
MRMAILFADSNPVLVVSGAVVGAELILLGIGDG